MKWESERKVVRGPYIFASTSIPFRFPKFGGAHISTRGRVTTLQSTHFDS